MDDAFNKCLRQKVEELLRKAIERLKQVKCAVYRKEAGQVLQKINQKLLEHNRIKTSNLHVFNDLIQKSLEKTYQNWVVENYNDDDSSGTSGWTFECFLNSDITPCVTLSENCIPSKDRFAGNAEQRLALKYPRKKIGTPDNRIISHNSAEASSNPLFKRRHELLAPAPQAATYGEHRRMMLQLQEDERKQNVAEAATYDRITTKINDNSSDISKQFSKTNPMSVESGCMQSPSSNNQPRLYNNNHIVGEKSQTSIRNEVRVLPETANKPTHQQRISECPTKDFETNDDTNDRVAKKSNTGKPKHKNKENHRELQDLISYTSEILPKIGRRKSVSIEDKQNEQYLKQFGITQTVKVVLQRPDDGQIASRTRSKSIDSTKYLENLDAAKPTVPGHSKISQRRESKSMEVKKPTAATTTSTRVTKPTARKSVSKLQNSVESINSSKHRNRSTNVINKVLTEKEHKLTKPNKTASDKGTRRSSSPRPTKKMRSSIQDSTDKRTVEKYVRVLDEESEDDEPTVLVANVQLNRNPQLNNDVKVHCHSDYMEKCCLCSYNGELMVRHYVYNHPKKAVYVSRVAPEQAQLIRVDPFSISGRKAVSRYGDKEIIVFRCHFCDLRLRESQELWLDHISKHTGEYRYKCTLCPTFARMPIDRVTHHSACTNPSMQLWHKYNFEENHLYAYICNKCNFVQVLFVNMVRHFREDHLETSLIEEGYTKFSLVNFSLQDEDTELPYGMVKTEPIWDDTNSSMQECVKQELELFDEYQTHNAAPFQEIVQEPHLLQTEVISIKKEILPGDINHCDTNTSDSIAEMGRDTCATFCASEPQERSQCSYTSSIRVKRLPGDILSTAVNNIAD